jgi:hypothetical protein
LIAAPHVHVIQMRSPSTAGVELTTPRLHHVNPYRQLAKPAKKVLKQNERKMRRIITRELKPVTRSRNGCAHDQPTSSDRLPD